MRRRNPVFALEMIQTLELLGYYYGPEAGSRNPVFALEMIQTKPFSPQA